MKKRIIIVLIPIIIIFLLLLGSYANDYEKRSKITLNEDIVTIEIKEKTLRRDKATIVITNKSNDELTYGNNYHIEEMHDGKWYETKPVNEVGSLAVGHILKPEETVELELNWNYEYGELPGGHYRIVYDFTTESSSKKIYAVAEFELGPKNTN